MNLFAFLAELKRRRVFRVAAAYAVVAFVIAQVADIFFPGLGLPEWSLRLVLLLLILGFPLALVLAWAFDITPAGVVRTEELTPASAAESAAVRPRDGGRAAGWLGVGILAGLVAVGAYSGVHAWRGAAPSSEAASLTAVAVFPFSVRGSAESEYLGEGMVDLLSAKLDGAGALRAVDPRALLGFLAREGGGAADLERGHAVAEHFGAGLYILGEAGRHEEAIGWYTALTETSALYGPIAHLRLGELHDRLGNRGKAAEHYARFVAIWEECDAELRPLREGADRRLVALRGGGG